MLLVNQFKHHAACVNKYFNDEELDIEIEDTMEDPIYENYRAVLDSKSTDETLVSSLFY